MQPWAFPRPCACNPTKPGSAKRPTRAKALGHPASIAHRKAFHYLHIRAAPVLRHATSKALRRFGYLGMDGVGAVERHNGALPYGSNFPRSNGLSQGMGLASFAEPER